MKARVMAGLTLCVVVGGIGGIRSIAGGGNPTPDAPGARAAPTTDLSRLPVSFVANHGRWDPRASWVAAGPEATAYFVDGAVRWALAPTGEGGPGWALDQALVGARSARPAASVAAEGRVSYLTGDRHQAGLRGPNAMTGLRGPNAMTGLRGPNAMTGLPTADELTLAQAWPGVDVAWSGAGGRIEAIYRLAPGADPSRVEVAWRGADALALTAGGRLEVATPVRTFEEGAPKAYQEVEGRRVPVDVTFELRGPDSYGFRLGSYDPALPVVIDPPVLLYSSFLGGDSVDEGEDIAVDSQGNAYVTGRTYSTAATFPETVGVFQPQNAGDFDAFVAKVNPSGTALLYATFLGGARPDEGRGIKVDGAGNAHVTGVTESTAATFPETPGAFQTENAGGFDAFVAKLDPTGSSLLYATFLGGNAADIAYDIGIDPSGNAYVTGETRSAAATFPETPGALQTQNAGPGFDVFVAKLNSTGTGLVYSTYLGGAGEVDRGTGIAVDAAGNAYMTGRTTSTAATFPETPGAFQPENAGGPVDAFVAKINPAGTALVYASFLGGSAIDAGHDIAIDGAGSAFVTGSTESTSATFPETPGVFQPERGANGKADAFVAKVNPSGTALDYNTYLGGAGDDIGFAIDVDAAGNAYVGGHTTSTAATFPDTPGWFQPEYGGSVDGFVAKVNPTATALASAGFLGGAGWDAVHGIAVDGSGNAYVTGRTSSTAATFPEIPGVFQPELAGGPVYPDAFVAKISAGDVGPTTTMPSTTTSPTTSTTTPGSTTTTTTTSDVYCGRFLATIVGTPGNDNIIGTQGRDVINGLGGDDTIQALNGDDVICGGDGADTIQGSSGDDVVRGNDGNDDLDGGGHNDYVTGDLGDDVVRGSDGDDRLVGAEGNDEIAGGGGLDFLGGGEGNDALNGGLGDDRLEGNAGDDRLVGNEGTDTLLGQEGRDRLNAHDTGGLTDTLDGGPEVDVCSSDATDVPPSLNEQDC